MYIQLSSFYRTKTLTVERLSSLFPLHLNPTNAVPVAGILEGYVQLVAKLLHGQSRVVLIHYLWRLYGHWFSPPSSGVVWGNPFLPI